VIFEFQIQKLFLFLHIRPNIIQEKAYLECMEVIHFLYVLTLGQQLSNADFLLRSLYTIKTKKVYKMNCINKERLLKNQ